MKKKKFNAIKFAVGALAIACFLSVWFFATREGTTLGKLMPNPAEVASRLMEATYEKIGPMTIWGHMWNSMRRVLVGFCIASVSGILLGLAMGWNRTCEAIFRPIFELLRPIPPLAWISLAIVWFGLGEGGKYFIIFVSGFSNVTINVYTGAKAVDPELIGAAKMLGCSNRRIFTSIVLPSSVPYIFTGLQIAISSSWAAVVAAEMVRSTNGIGWLITAGQSIGDMGQVMVGIIVIGVVGFLLATIMRGVESKLCAWSRVQD
ncbi:ABC transporter permease [Dysosmobacter sp. NSJ-60]|uniref:ABC transporter permease n=1 Tax=Pusillibacter faecalis TaxID=2714358 RepID=UPI00164D9C96|nr:ABC transporter permease [Pusillibacter faecalis]MBC5747922.1 ABC transporter permease [Dysosmobacter hominis]MBS5656946.1 ABC transporter permease [Oscillibacter sp.]MCQ5027082.1 ABC transporter permease [Oscillibacter valericigenes]